VASPSIGDPILNDIYRYWLSKRRNGKAPRRADIKAGELGPAIRQLNILDVVREAGKPLQFRHRLVGTGILEWLNMDATGRMVDETLYGPEAAAIIASLSHIVETARPYHRRARLDWNNRKFALMESVDMPLSDDTHDVAMILRATSYRHAAADDPPPLFEELPLA
jgi:hypothetical protein